MADQPNPLADLEARYARMMRVFGPLLTEHDSFVLATTHHHDATSRYRHESAHRRADEAVREWRAELDRAGVPEEGVPQ